MSTMMKDRDALRREARYYTVGWILLAVAVLAVAITLLATAARPHVLWLFSTSYGAVMMVVGVTLIRVGHRAHAARGDHSPGLEGCRP
jgi:fucose permease